jgi:hypothetical protein
MNYLHRTPVYEPHHIAHGIMTRTQSVERTIDYLPDIFLTGSMKELYKRGKSLCEADTPCLLITGESGTGKELLAKSIHYCRPVRSSFQSAASTCRMPISKKKLKPASKISRAIWQSRLAKAPRTLQRCFSAT